MIRWRLEKRNVRMDNTYIVLPFISLYSHTGNHILQHRCWDDKEVEDIMEILFDGMKCNMSISNHLSYTISWHCKH